FFISDAQTTLVLQPDATAGKDAFISNINGEASVNFGNDQMLTTQGSPARRFLIQFNFSSIPANATVISANLYLYAYDPGNGGHTPAASSYIYLNQNTSAWTESTVAWSNAPTTSFSSASAQLPVATTSNQNYIVDVRNLVQQNVTNAAFNYGWQMTQSNGGRLEFASSDNSNAALRPKLVITYAICSGNPPPATISPTSPVTICSGAAQIFTANAGAGYVYQWYDGVSQYIGSGNSISATTSGNYKVVVTNPQGCTATSASVPLTVRLENVDIRTQANSPSYGCINGAGMVMNADTGTGFTYQWKKNGNNITGATAYIYTAHDTAIYSCIISSSGCSITSNNIEGKLYTGSAVTTQPTYTCNGTTTLMSSSQTFSYTGSETWQWQKNNVNIPGGTGYNYDATSTGLYRVIMTTPYCPVSVTTNAISVNTNTSPLLELQSQPAGNPVNTCVNGPTWFTLYHIASQGGGMFTNTTNTTYEWYVNGVPEPNMNYFNEFIYGSANLTVQVVTACGSMGYSKEVHAAYPGLIGPDFTINNGCDSVKLNFSHFIYPWNSYQWKLNGVPIAGATGAEYYAKQNGNYSCLVDNGCDTTTSITKTVNLITSPTATPAGPINVCSGSVYLYTQWAQGYTYQWTKNGVNISFSNNQSYTVSSTGSYACKVTSNGCTRTTNAVMVNYGVPSAVIGGGTSICAGGSTALFVAPQPSNQSFQWKKNNVAIAGATSYLYNATTAGDYICDVITSCGAATSNILSVTVANGGVPSIPSAVTGALRPCAGASGIIYSVNNVAGTTYNWIVPANVTVVSGQGTNTLTVNFSAAFVNGSLSVTPGNGCGAGPARTVLLSKESPRTPGSISGFSAGVCNVSNVIYTIPPTANATTYLWNVPAGVIINSGQGTTSINVNFPAAFIAGTVSVKAGSSCGYGAARNLAVKGAPATAAVINGPVTACANQQGVIYSIAAIPSATTYNWLVPSGASITSGQNTTSITMNFGTAGGNMRARAGNACGTGAYRNLAVSIVCREGMEDGNNSISFNIYPNPSREYFTINLEGALEETYSIVVNDIIGKEITSSNNNSSEVPLNFGSELAPGIYFVTVKCGLLNKVMRIVKE
ncbi:MAG: DNRLRE domain-containing protein, partial [Bacteroidota bacterium]